MYSQGTAIWYDCFKWWYQRQIFIKSEIQWHFRKADSILRSKLSLEVEFDKKWRELWRFQNQNKGIFSLISAFAEIENWYSVFSTFLVLFGIGFKFGQFLKRIPVLKSSGPQLSRGCINFFSTWIFMYVMKHFTFFFRFQKNISLLRTIILKPS